MGDACLPVLAGEQPRGTRQHSSSQASSLIVDLPHTSHIVQCLSLPRNKFRPKGTGLVSSFVKHNTYREQGKKTEYVSQTKMNDCLLSGKSTHMKTRVCA